MNLFYLPEIGSSIHVTLSDDESAHCIRVLRRKTGDIIFLTDGNGMFYEGEIITENAKKCSIKIIRTIPDTTRRNFHLTIAIAPTKNMDRFEWFLEKVTEIGCDEIVPIRCKHSERRTIKIERLHKLMISAMKQCLKSQFPLLHNMQDFKTFIDQRHPEKNYNDSVTQTPLFQKFIGHIPELSESEFPPQNPKGKPFSDALIPIKTSLSTTSEVKPKIIFCIGPEGGFTDAEALQAEQCGFIPVSLGNSRLRVETAGVVACSIVNVKNC